MSGSTSDESAEGNISPESWGRYIFENSDVGIAISEIDGRFLMANPSYQRITGFSEAELRGLTPLDITDEADRPATQQRISQLTTGGPRQFQIEKRYRRKDGSVIWVRSTVSLIPASPRSPRCLLMTAEDITDRIRATDALRQQNEILQKVFDHVPLLISLFGSDGQIKLVNRQWEHTLGWTLEEIRDRGIDIFVECYPDPRQRQEVVDFIVAATGEWRDFKPRARDGRTLDTMWTNVRLSDGTAIGIGAEITERKRAEEALRESERRLRRLAENIREVLWMVDPNAGRVLYVNPAYEQVWGRTCESLYRDWRSSVEAIHPEDRPRLLAAIYAQGRDAMPIETTYRVIRPDGSVRWVWDRSFPVRDAAGEIYRFVGIAEDVTESRQVAEQLRRSEFYLAQSERLSHIGTWAVRIPSREINFWSQEHYRIFGFDPEKGLPTLEEALARLHADDQAARKLINQMLAEPKDFEADYRIVLPGGHIRHLHSVGHPVLNDAGELVEFIGIVQDVTERKRVEGALRRSLKRLHAVGARMERVREEERTRLAREIHDELGQALTGIKMDLRSMFDRPPAGKERRRRSQVILQGVDDAIQSVRRIATELRPGILDDLGLVAAVDWAAQEFAKRTGTKCTLSLPRKDLAIEPEVATALFRILQETLTNIARHSGATEFSVRLAEEDSHLSLEIHDNGRGFEEPLMGSGRSLGILGMQERAFLLGGSLTISTLPEEGVTVTARIPRLRDAGGRGD